jgi:hypothetical protein
VPARQQDDPVGHPIKSWGHPLRTDTAALFNLSDQLLFYDFFTHRKPPSKFSGVQVVKVVP